jgi:hypothetical protein
MLSRQADDPDVLFELGAGSRAVPRRAIRSGSAPTTSNAAPAAGPVDALSATQGGRRLVAKA